MGSDSTSLIRTMASSSSPLFESCKVRTKLGEFVLALKLKFYPQIKILFAFAKGLAIPKVS